MPKYSGKLILSESRPEEILRMCKRAKTETDPVERAHMRNQFACIGPELRKNNPALFKRVCEAWMDLNRMAMGPERFAEVVAEHRAKARLLGSEDVSEPL